AATGEPLTPPLRHSGPLSAASFSPDGRQAAVAALDGSVRVWDLSDAQGSAEALLLRTRLLTGRQVDPRTGGAAGVLPEALAASWHAVRQRDAEPAAASPAELLAWHRQEADE